MQKEIGGGKLISDIIIFTWAKNEKQLCFLEKWSEEYYFILFYFFGGDLIYFFIQTKSQKL